VHHARLAGDTEAVLRHGLVAGAARPGRARTARPPRTTGPHRRTPRDCPSRSTRELLEASRGGATWPGSRGGAARTEGRAARAGRSGPARAGRREPALDLAAVLVDRAGGARAGDRGRACRCWRRHPSPSSWRWPTATKRSSTDYATSWTTP
jgi:hypothetical protein